MYKMVQMRGRGASYAKIADAVGYSIVTVGKFFRDGANVPPPAPAWVYLDARLLAAQGHFPSDIAERTGLPVEEVRRCTAGVPVVGPPPKKDHDLPDRIAKLIQEGKSRTTVAAILKIPLWKAYKYGNGVRSHSDDLPDQIVAMLRKGMSRKAVAFALGVSKSTVDKYGKGVEPDNQALPWQIAEMLAMGYSWDRVSERFGVSLETVQRHAAKLSSK